MHTRWTVFLRFQRTSPFILKFCLPCIYIWFPSPLYLISTLHKDWPYIGHSIVKNFTNVEKNVGTKPIMVEIEPTKSLPRLSQYLLLFSEEKKNFNHIVEGLRAKGYVIPSTNPHNAFSPLVLKKIDSIAIKILLSL